MEVLPNLEAAETEQYRGESLPVFSSVSRFFSVCLRFSFDAFFNPFSTFVWTRPFRLKTDHFHPGLSKLAVVGGH